VRVLHLAGHGRKECCFIWNVNDTSKESKEFDVDAIALADEDCFDYYEK